MQAALPVNDLEQSPLRLVVWPGGLNHAVEPEPHATVVGQFARRHANVLLHGQLMGQRHAQKADGEAQMGQGHAPVGQRRRSTAEAPAAHHVQAVGCGNPEPEHKRPAAGPGKRPAEQQPKQQRKPSSRTTAGQQTAS